MAKLPLPYNIKIKIQRITLKNISIEEFKELLSNSSIEVIAYFNNIIDSFFSNLRYKTITHQPTLEELLLSTERELVADFYWYSPEEYKKLSKILLEYWDFEEDARRYS